MSSRKRNGNKDQRDKMRLRMDTKTPTPRISDPSLPAGRRREIDNVMKKARASPNSNAYWDKRLLEVEAKDPNRWRHSGFKSLYVDGSPPSPGHFTRSRSPFTRARSPFNRRLSRSPNGQKSSSPAGRRSSPSPRARRSRSPGGRRKSRSPVSRRSSRSPPFRRSLSGRRSPPTRRSSDDRRSLSSRRSSVSRRSPGGRRSPPINRTAKSGGRPHSPLSPPRHKGRRSPSGSSMSSCSDESCSVCSPRSRRRSRTKSISPRPKIAAKNGPVPKPRQRPPSPHPPPKRIARPATPPPARKLQRPENSDKPTDPRRQPPPPKPRNTSGELIEVAGIKPIKKPGKKKDKINQSVMPMKIKQERTKKRLGSPDSSASENSTCSVAPVVATTCLTLSDRFGKMAQWSIDRERRDIENMRITKNSSGGDLKVMIEEDDFLYGRPPERYSHSPVPAGHFPDELLPAGPSGLAAWDDVRVRYQYYKDLGYLRDLSLDDYVKWEEWWYKYQEWLANERHYEHWLTSQRRRRKRVPASQRLN